MNAVGSRDVFSAAELHGVLVLPAALGENEWRSAAALPELWGLSDIQWRLDNLLFPDPIMISFLFLITVGLWPLPPDHSPRPHV